MLNRFLGQPVFSAREPGASTCTADNIFPRAGIDFLNAYADRHGGSARDGEVVQRDASAKLAHDVRRSQVIWLPETPESRPIYEFVAGFVQQANQQIFHLELSGFSEPFQIATYAAEDAGFYGWHVDIGAGRLANRKLSLIIPLTDPAAYEGGRFEVFHDHEPTPVDMPIGRVLAFPSYLLHRVTPVTRGRRRSLVMWVSGPPFR